MQRAYTKKGNGLIVVCCVSNLQSLRSCRRASVDLLRQSRCPRWSRSPHSIRNSRFRVDTLGWSPKLWICMIRQLRRWQCQWRAILLRRRLWGSWRFLSYGASKCVCCGFLCLSCGSWDTSAAAPLWWRLWRWVLSTMIRPSSCAVLNDVVFLRLRMLHATAPFLCHLCTCCRRLLSFSPQVFFLYYYSSRLSPEVI